MLFDIEDYSDFYIKKRLVTADAYEWVKERADHIRDNNPDMPEGMEFGIAWKQYKKKHPKWKSKKQKEKKKSISRLKRVAMIYEGFNCDDYDDDKYYEVFKNPTDVEIAETLKNDEYNSIRGIILNDGTVYIWPGCFVHEDINSHLKNKIDVNGSMRFAWDNNDWTIDCAKQYTIEEAKELIRKNKSILDRIGNTNCEFFIFFSKDGGKQEVIQPTELFNQQTS